MSLAKDCVAQGCGVHVFLLSYQEVGGAWPGHIPYLTGGALHTYEFLQVSLPNCVCFVFVLEKIKVKHVYFACFHSL